MNKLSIGITLALLFGFCFIMWAADSVGAVFGKTGEMLALIAIAIILVIGLLQAHKESKNNNQEKGNEDFKDHE